MRPEMRILKQHLLENGLKLTRQRVIIAERFLASEGHLSAEDLFQDLLAEHHRVGRATVYRALKTLVDAGLAQMRHFPDGAIRYENVYGEPAHDHLVCTGCERIIEFENPYVELLYRRAAELHGFVAAGHRLVVTGLCADCRPDGGDR